MNRLTMRRIAGIWALLAVAASGAFGARQGTIYTTHFFDWYKVTPQRSYETAQREWTYHPLWDQYGIKTDEIGNTQHYYSTQMRMIRKAGFDGIHYEWFTVQPSDAFIAAIKETQMPVALFYDVEIAGAAAKYQVVPTDAYARKLAGDVASFYERIPKPLWLHQADGALPIIFYCYRFDQSSRDVSAWDRFFRTLVTDMKQRLGSPVHIYWTDAGTWPQAYAYQHFPEISPYTFGWWGSQTQIGAHCVTLIAGYDDGGATVQGRTTRTIANDIRFLEEDVALARASHPKLVFHYGWNEFFEGENIMPDATWGDWRLQALTSIVSSLRKPSRKPALPATLILADDLFPRVIATSDQYYDRERTLLSAYRYLFPNADVLLSKDVTPDQMGRYKVIVALDRDRSTAEEDALVRAAQSGRTKVAVFAPQDRIAAQFAKGPRKQALVGVAQIPVDQWASAQQSLDIDAARYPILHFRVRNTLNTFYHVRFKGVDADGKVYDQHDNGPLDFQSSGGEWAERTESARAILEEYAKKPIVRITGVTFYLDGVGMPGIYTEDVTDVRFASESGEVGARLDFSTPANWLYTSSFVNDPEGKLCVGTFKVTAENGGTLHLQTQGCDALSLPADDTSQAFALQTGVRTLASDKRAGQSIPVLLQQGNLFWVNTLSPSPVVYAGLMPALGIPGFHVTHHTTYATVKDNFAILNSTALTVLPSEELPLDRVRLVSPPGLTREITYPCPVSSVPLAMVRTRDGVGRISPLVTQMTKDGRCITPDMITLQPGEVADLYRIPIRVRPLGGAPVQVEVTEYSRDGALLSLKGAGKVRLSTTRPRVRLRTLEGGPVPDRAALPCQVRLSGPMERR